MGAGESKETLSILVRLDPCTAHHNIYGQVLTRKLQHRRCHFPLLSRVNELKSLEFLISGTVHLELMHLIGAAFKLSRSISNHLKTKDILCKQRMISCCAAFWYQCWPDGWTRHFARKARDYVPSSDFTPWSKTPLTSRPGRRPTLRPEEPIMQLYSLNGGRRLDKMVFNLTLNMIKTLWTSRDEILLKLRREQPFPKAW